MAKPKKRNDAVRDPRVDDYKGILDPKEAKRRAMRNAREKKLPKPTGRPKGSFSLRTMIRNTLKTLRGNRPLSQHLVDALVDAGISGDRNFKTSALKLILEHLEGKPTQTIVADVANRDGYAYLSDEELLRIAGMRPLEPGAGKADGGES